MGRRHISTSRISTTDRLGPALTGALLLLLGACASRQVGYMDPDQVYSILRDRGLDPAALVYPHAVTQEMRQWAAEMTARATSADERLALLQSSLLNPDNMSIRYQWGYTGTAVEVFEQRNANCLAFTNLFVGMARSMDLQVYYLAVHDIESYRKEGDLVVISDHIAVGYGDMPDRRIFDFSENPPDDYRKFAAVPDLTAISMYYSNRGAEALQAGFTDVAVEWLETSVKIDPDLGNAWVNLGVALRRQGNVKRAERAYRLAIELDPRIYSAYQNLASLLRLQGRHQEARSYEDLLATSPTRNPYTYLSLGDISLQGGRLAEAEKLYRRAVRLGPEDPEIYAALGEISAALGDLRTARRMLKKAQRLDAEASRVKLLAQSLGRAPSEG